jgi:hypothetical protein
MEETPRSHLLLAKSLDELCSELRIKVERVAYFWGISPPPGEDKTYWLRVVGTSEGGVITLREDLGVYTSLHLFTWVHEFAHELLHYPKPFNRVGSFVSERSCVKEAEADAVATYVGEELNMDLPENFMTDCYWAMQDHELIVANKIINRYRKLQSLSDVQLMLGLIQSAVTRTLSETDSR